MFALCIKMEFPFRIYTDDVLLNDYNRLKNYSKDCCKELVKSKIGYKCSNAFFQYERLNTPSQKKKSAVDNWYANTNKILTYCAKHPQKDLFGNIQFLYHPPAQFPPGVATQIYEIYKPNVVLDPFAGWGDRCIAAMAKDIDYIGIDSNKNLQSPYEKMVNFYTSSSNIQMIFEPSETVPFENFEFDMVLTSPPFWRDGVCLEQYAWFENTDFNEFMKKVFKPVFFKCIRNARVSCFYIPLEMAKFIQSNYRVNWNRELKFKTSGNKIIREDIIYCFNRYS